MVFYSQALFEKLFHGSNLMHLLIGGGRRRAATAATRARRGAGVEATTVTSATRPARQK